MGCTSSLPDRAVTARLLGNSIHVSWPLKEYPDFVKYCVQVHRNHNKDGGVVDVTTESYEMTTEPASKYVFEVWACCQSGEKKRMLSNVVLTPPSAVTGAHCSEDDGIVKMTWDASTTEKVTYCVNAYLSKGKKKLGPVQLVQNPVYEFKSGEKRNQYTFAVWAKSQYGVEGQKIEITHDFSGAVHINVLIMMKANGDIMAACGARNVDLSAVKSTYSREGFVPCHPENLQGIIYRGSTYNVKLSCTKPVDGITKDGQLLRASDLQFGEPKKFIFAVRPEHSGDYALKFKIEKQGKAVIAHPFHLNFTKELEQRVVYNVVDIPRSSVSNTVLQQQIQDSRKSITENGNNVQPSVIEEID